MKITQIKYRIIADVLIFSLIFVGPWWLSIVLISAGIFLFRHFYESLALAIFLDGLYSVPGVTFFGTGAFFTIIIVAIFLLSIFLKTRLKFYRV